MMLPSTVYILLSNWSLTPRPQSLFPPPVRQRYLRAYKAPSTTVEESLQIRLFMQNKPNLLDAQMNVNKVLTKDYGNETLGGSGKNKANSKPNKANLLNAQMNVNKVLTTDYENIANCALAENKANSNPIQTQYKPNFKGVSQCRSRSRRSGLPWTESNPISPPQINTQSKTCHRGENNFFDISLPPHYTPNTSGKCTNNHFLIARS